MLRHFARSERGQTVVEFALSVIVLLVLVLGIFDTARAVWFSNTLALATREAARCAIVAGAACSGTNAPSAVVAAYSIGVSPVPTVTTSYCSLPPSQCPTPDGIQSVGSYVTVTATSLYVPLASRFFVNGALSVDLSGSSTQIIRSDVTASASTPSPTPVPTVTPTPSPTPTPTASPTPSPSPSPTPSPTPLCTVPKLKGVLESAAQSTWNSASFVTAVGFSGGYNANTSIKTQSLTAGSLHPCATATITVS